MRGERVGPFDWRGRFDWREPFDWLGRFDWRAVPAWDKLAANCAGGPARARECVQACLSSS